MRRTKQIVCRGFVFILLVLFSACSKPANKPFDGTFQYTSFADIPGVTEDEIKAIEALREQFDHFRYGMIPSTESFYDDNGSLRGYAALFCEWLTRLFGIPFIPENTEVYDLLDKLASNEVDFTGVMTATEERRETFFMTTAIALHTVQYSRIAGSAPLESIASLRPLRYAFMRGASTIDLVTSKLIPGTYEIIITSSIDEVYRMLKSGEVDAAFHVNREIAYDVYGDVVASDFFPLIYTSASLAAQNPALEPVISVVQKALDNGALSYLVDLYNTGYHEYLKHKLFTQLTEEERNFIREHTVIPFAAETGNYPVSFYNKRERQWQGIAFDVLREVEALTGFRFERVNNENDDWPVILKMLEDDKAAMITELMYTTERDGKFLWPEAVNMADNPALISRIDFRNIFLNEILYIRVGLVKDYGHTALFREWFPEHPNNVEYETTLDAFNALDRGEVDVVMTSNHELLIMTNYMERTGFKTNFLFDNVFNSTLGFNKNEAVLCSIVDKALKMIDTKSISAHWMSVTYDYSRKISEARLPWFMGSSILLFCVVSLVAVLYIKSTHTSKELEKLVKERTHDLSLQTAKLQAMFDSLPDIVFCKDLNLRYTQCNKITEEYNGLKEAEIIGKTDIEISEFPAEVSEKIMEKDRAVLREGTKHVIEETMPYYNGVTRVLETIRAPLVQDGVMTGLIVIARDITRRKEIEKELALQTTMLTTLFDSIPDLIFAKNLDFRYIHCNKSYLEHLGFRREDLIGNDDVAGGLWLAEVAEEYRKWDRKVMNERQTFMIEEPIPRVDGTNPLYETVKAPLILDGAVIGLLGISRDITKRKEMEEAALAASRSKSAFLAHMSHEIRTPMNSILGFSELALDGEASAKTRDYLGKIQMNADWLLQILNDILDISKIESGKMELENIPFDMHELFASCRTLITPKAEEKGITLHFYAEPSIGKKPLGDPTRLRQVLFNLLSNAVKFTNSGIVKLNAKVTEKSELNIKMYFEVKDSGIGMTPEQMKKIFDPFTQAEAGTTRQYGGTGLGLSITKNIVEMMGGKLLVESTYGVGSKFSFELTFDTIDVPNDEMSGQKIVFNELEKPTFEGEVLLCEDNAMNQQVICEHLTRVGLKTVVAENGKIGVEMVKDRKKKGEKQFDLIFMDMHMPVMDGLEASAEILELKTGVPIVAMTANIMSSDWEIYKESGMSDCVGKPFTSQELWRCLMKYFTPVNRGSEQNKTYTEIGPEFQKKLQLMFVKSNQNKYEEIVNALKEDDIKLAHRLAHTLKGNAGQIGQSSLQKTAADIENKLKDGKNNLTEEHLRILESELKIVLNDLSPFLESQDRTETAAVETVFLEPEQARELIEKLEPMLEMGNAECSRLTDDIRRIQGNETLISQMIHQIESFEFEQAVVTLAELKKEFGL